jgi:hypothetical protein
MANSRICSPRAEFPTNRADRWIGQLPLVIGSTSHNFLIIPHDIHGQSDCVERVQVFET